MAINMTIKEQWNTIKKNWLIALVLIVLVLTPLASNASQTLVNTFSANSFAGYGVAEDAMMKTSYYPSPSYGDFAPEVQDRIITKTASLSSEVKRGEFTVAEDKLKDIVTSSDSFLLNENSNRYGEGVESYYTGYYTIKVETSKYSAVLAQLKELGKVTAFNENQNDITGSYTNLQLELSLEKGRLQKYQDLYSQATSVGDKLDLEDRIFNEERTIKYLEDSLKNMDSRVDYSTISLTLQEKQSGYLGVVFVKFSQLVKSLVDSINSVLRLIFIVLPWAVVVLIIWVLAKVSRKGKKKR